MTSNSPVVHRPKRPVRAHWTGFLRDASHREVRVGELAIINGGPSLHCRAVGSTLAVCVHIRRLSLAGVLHVAFPSARQHRALGLSMPMAFADNGVSELVCILGELDASPSEVEVALVGGSGLMTLHPTYDGPARLVRAVEAILTANELAVRQRHLGGSRARHVHCTVHGQLLVELTGGQP